MAPCCWHGSRQQAIDWTNLIAPEHVTTTRKNLPDIVSAGSIFLGEYSAQAAGDYGSGPNHVLPTGGAARFRGGLSVTRLPEGDYGAGTVARGFAKNRAVHRCLGQG